MAATSECWADVKSDDRRTNGSGDVFDASGARVRTLVNAQSPAGAFTARWDGRVDAGRRAASGIYFARVEHDGATRAYKLVMLK